MPEYIKLFIGLVLGAVLGIGLHSSESSEAITVFIKTVLDPVSQIFLRTLFMTVVPLVFCGVVLGVLQLGEQGGVKAVVKKTLFYTILMSSISVVIGISLVSIVKPGVGFVMPAQIDSVEKIKTLTTQAKPFYQAIVELIPKNPLESAVKALDGEMLSLMVFALCFGIALSQVLRTLKTTTHTIIDVLDVCYQSCMTIISFIMRLAPFAVFALVFKSSFQFGMGLFVSLFYYVLVVIAALLIQQFVVYAGLLKLLTKHKPLDFFAKCKEVYLYAFSTASSNATLPKSIHCAEHVLHLPKSVSRFVLTVGSTANQNGTALFEGVTVLFLAQVYQIDLTIIQQVQVVLMSILAGIGTAGVPGGSLPLIMILLQQVGIPAEGLGIILGVDRFLDMARTTVNVSGDLVVTALVSEKKST